MSSQLLSCMFFRYENGIILRSSEFYILFTCVHALYLSADEEVMLKRIVTSDKLSNAVTNTLAWWSRVCFPMEADFKSWLWHPCWPSLNWMVGKVLGNEDSQCDIDCIFFWVLSDLWNGASTIHTKCFKMWKLVILCFSALKMAIFSLDIQGFTFNGEGSFYASIH